MTGPNRPVRRSLHLFMRRPVLPASLIAALLMVFGARAVAVQAHANLVRSQPAAGAALPAAPTQVQLWFSEQPDPHFSDIQVLNDQRQRVDAGDMHVAPDDNLSLIVSVKPLPDGLYTVSWKTTSAVDGHVVNGSFPFYVGQPPAGASLAATAQSGPSSSGTTPNAGNVSVQWIGLLMAVVLLGGFTFWPLVARPALRAALAPRPGPGAMAVDIAMLPVGNNLDAAFRTARRVLWIAWLLLVGVTIAELLLRTATASGASFAHLFGAPLRTVLFQSRYGQVWCLRSGAVLVAGVALAARPLQSASRRALPATLVGALATEAVFVAFGLNSHEAALPSNPLAATLSVFFHLTAAGFWIGGLVQFVLVVVGCLPVLDPAQRLRFLASAVPRFSTLAMISVATLVASGIYQAIRQVSGWDALWLTGWGRTLDIKLLLLVPLLLLGAFNLLRVRPALAKAAERNKPGAQAQERRGWLGGIRLEKRFLLAIGAESLLGVVILLVVGVLINQPPPQTAAASSQPGIHLTSKAEGVTVKISITPGQLGQNHFEAVATRNGKAPPGGTQLVLRLTYADADLGTSELPMKAEGKGHYGADSSDLSTYGHWQILALVQPPGADEVRTDFALNLSQAGASGASSQATGDTSVSKGRQLYMANCAQCHGQDAHGDGPQAKFLDPPPVDLIVHVPQHSDQQLLDWITNGIPASAMPAFGKKLNAQQRQAVLNYLRDLTKNATATATPTPP